MAEQAPAPLRVALRRRYAIQQELGRGGTALVFLAHDLKHDRPVAIKVLHPEIAVARGAERFLREIRLASRLQHPHILPVYDSGEVSAWLYFVMPWIDGESLRQRLGREGRVPLEDALRITGEICDALSYAHSQDIVHRDIKPENILLTRGHALVADFGIARAITAAARHGVTDSGIAAATPGDLGPEQASAELRNKGRPGRWGDNVTDTGIAVGTPAYMSPEQADPSLPIDGRSDIYSLGCVLYEMLGGDPPFTGPTAQDILVRHARDPVPPLGTSRTAVPEQVERALMKALEKAPANRFPTVVEFAHALAAPLPGIGRVPIVTKRASALIAGTAALFVTAGWLAVNTWSADAPAIRSVAVLPLANLMDDSTQDYFVDGMHEALVAELAKIQAVTVISRTSVLRYRGTAKTVPEIARELGVDAIVEGSVFRAGDSVRVATQLIDGRTDRHLWAETYLRDLRDVLRLHGELATAMAEQIRITVTPSERSRLSSARQVDPDVYVRAIKGQYECEQWTEDGFRRGIALLRETIDRDPTYAPAHARLAACYADRSFFMYAPPAESNQRAMAAVRRALELDSTLGEAHATLGWIRFVTDLDFDGPDQDFRQALELSPGSAQIHVLYSNYLTLAGRFDDAIAHNRRAIDLDPLSVNTSLSLGWTYYKARRYVESITQLHRTLELEPGYWWALMELAWAYLQEGMPEVAVAHCDSAAARTPQADDQVLLSSCGWVYGRAGRTEKAEAMLRRLTAISGRRWLDPFNLSMVYVGLGRWDRALEGLRQAARERSQSLVFLRVDPWLDPLRSDPRFKALLRELGIES